jgi:hypothetical protein
MINFISGLMTGGLFGILLMCLLQINRVNELQRRIDKAIEFVKEYIVKKYFDDREVYFNIFTWNKTKDDLLEILCGDVDDEKGRNEN